MTASEHALLRNGAAHWLTFFVVAPEPAQPPDGPGHAACSCGWVSEPLPTTEARCDAHTQHVRAASLRAVALTIAHHLDKAVEDHFATHGCGRNACAQAVHLMRLLPQGWYIVTA